MCGLNSRRYALALGKFSVTLLGAPEPPSVMPRALAAAIAEIAPCVAHLPLSIGKGRGVSGLGCSLVLGPRHSLLSTCPSQRRVSLMLHISIGVTAPEERLAMESKTTKQKIKSNQIHQASTLDTVNPLKDLERPSDTPSPLVIVV